MAKKQECMVCEVEKTMPKEEDFGQHIMSRVWLVKLGVVDKLDPRL